MINAHSAHSLRGKPAAEQLYFEIQKRIQTFERQFRRKPKLVVILVGTDPASLIYTSKKQETATSLGMLSETLQLDPITSAETLYQTIQKLNHDPTVDGILVQRPVPSHIREEELVNWICPEKDVDSFHPENMGRSALGLPGLRSCTPAGIIDLLDYYQISLKGKLVSVVGRSSIVGKPMAQLLINRDATVIQCHSKTENLKSLTLQADLVVAAIGKPHFFDRSYFSKNAVVVDVGIHKNSLGKTIGDVNTGDVAEVVSAITPVPGGVGIMTIAKLMENTVLAAELRSTP